MGKCPAWCEGEQGLFSFSRDRCYATKEMEVCDCLGNEAFCDFYPEKRKAATQPKFGEWISVKDRLPEDGVRVLVSADSKSDDPVIAITHYTHRKYGYNIEGWIEPWQYFFYDHEITHWMPLPEPPKEDAQHES